MFYRGCVRMVERSLWSAHGMKQSWVVGQKIEIVFGRWLNRRRLTTVEFHRLPRHRRRAVLARLKRTRSFLLPSSRSFERLWRGCESANKVRLERWPNWPARPLSERALLPAQSASSGDFDLVSAILGKRNQQAPGGLGFSVGS